MLAALTLSTVLAGAWASAIDGPIAVEITDHNSCRYKPDNNGRLPAWNRKIEFPSEETSKLENDPEAGPNCYKLGGDVKLWGELQGDMQVHFELSHDFADTGDFERDPCFNYNETTGCGGVGSCMYCDVCGATAFPDESTLKNTTHVVLRRGDGTRLYCDDIAKPPSVSGRVNARVTRQIRARGRGDGRRAKGRGTYARRARIERMWLHFCLPNKRTFLKLKGVDEETYNDWDKNGGVPDSIGVFMTIRVFEHTNSRTDPIQLLVRQRHQETALRANLNLKESDSIPFNKRKTLAFNSVVWQNRGFIGCHTVLANIKLNP